MPSLILLFSRVFGLFHCAIMIEEYLFFPALLDNDKWIMWKDFDAPKNLC
jgi:hypothetical protein